MPKHELSHEMRTELQAAISRRRALLDRAICAVVRAHEAAAASALCPQSAYPASPNQRRNRPDAQAEEAEF
jgi:hypothetical protein